MTDNRYYDISSALLHSLTLRRVLGGQRGVADIALVSADRELLAAGLAESPATTVVRQIATRALSQPPWSAVSGSSGEVPRAGWGSPSVDRRAERIPIGSGRQRSWVQGQPCPTAPR